MGIRDKEKERQEVKSNVSTIVGKESTEKSEAEETPNEKLTQKAYYITADQYYKLRMLSVKRNKDISSLLREILDEYFSEIEI